MSKTTVSIDTVYRITGNCLDQTLPVCSLIEKTAITVELKCDL